MRNLQPLSKDKFKNNQMIKALRCKGKNRLFLAMVNASLGLDGSKKLGDIQGLNINIKLR
jgi:hypothetical protein